MKKNLFQHLIAISATGLACAAVLLGNPVPFLPASGNNGRQWETAMPGSAKSEKTGRPGNGQEISPLNDENDDNRLPTYVTD